MGSTTMPAAQPAPVPPAIPAERRRRPGAAGFRGDIQGLRAVAVLLVLAFHAGIPGVQGGYVGVDVFFVISGFLITGLMIREVESTGRLNLRRFWARRVRRLLPAATVTLTAVAVAVLVVLPVTRWPSIAWDLLAGAMYVMNWRLAEESVDYLAAESAPSPVQHFWSLAVEEQFYIGWPLVVIAVIAIARHRGWRPRRAMFGSVLLLGACSLGWSAWLTEAEPGRAYFVTTTRAWELALGAALAIVAPRLARLPRVPAEALSWAGLAAITWAAVTFDETTAFPGVAALVPTLGAAAVVTAGIGTSEHTACRALNLPVMRDVGALSYSLYLWHWPVLVAAAAVWGRDDGTLWWPVAVLAAGFSVVPAWLTYRVVEEPIHHGRFFAGSSWRAAGLGTACTAVGVGAAVVVASAVPTVSYPSEEEAPGAAALMHGGRAVVADVALDPVAAVDDAADVYADGCHQQERASELVSCVYGDPDSEIEIALAGDSHAAQWQPALQRVASSHGWRLETYTKSACALSDVTLARGGEPYISCDEWNARLMDVFTGPDRPDVVVLSASNAREAYSDDGTLGETENDEVLADGLERTWSAIRDGGAEVVVIRDTPWRTFATPECVAENPDALHECESDALSDLNRNGRSDVLARERTEGITWVDMTDYICPDGRCPAVIGNVIVWQDRHHLTGRYSSSLAAALDEGISRAVRRVG
ncbi:acyltransferase family protein [Phytoactinopolyspora halotolerans]|uniref:Acyltransferase n=1 Tax=Phytoactinopolyspora halotolerans TaxID=1981512 RepID=A0A6L9S9Z5_9ACTN|nr:acyltransferase family protein [Phytoactinopolyspora halotolerans]NEE01454.1 acyltransferase [Phytoactinopolyspora halotolerans]